MERSLGNSCHDPVRCSELSLNQAHGASAAGGALFVDSGATASVLQTYFEGNQGDFGAVAAIGGGGSSHLFLEGSVIAQNWGYTMIQLTDIGTLRAGFITVANNNPPQGSPPATGQTFYSHSATSSEADIYSSVVYDFGGAVASIVGPNDTFDCLLVHSDLGLEGGNAVLVANPLFRNPALYDYHLQGASPAVDYCDTTIYNPVTTDVDDDTRGVDEPNVPDDPYGPYDLGADEYSGDAFFADGFESGNTSGWSSTT